MDEFRLTPEQLAILWSTRSSLDDQQDLISALESSVQFILNDDQFRSLLGTVSVTHSPSATTTGSNVSSTDRHNPQPSTLTSQLAAMHERLKSSVQAHAEIVNVVSDAMLKRNRIESTVNLVHQLSLHTIDDISKKDIETIPSFVLDLLKMDSMSENTYQSIKQGEITSDNNHITKTVINQIQADHLSFTQIHKIQTQFLTPKLLGKHVVLILSSS